MRDTVFLTVSNQRIRATKHCDITPCLHVTVPLLGTISLISETPSTVATPPNRGPITCPPLAPHPPATN